MPKTIRQQIVEAVTARFQTILVANGYKSDLGKNVNRFRNVQHKPIEPEELPALNLMDLKDELEAMASGRHKHHLNFEAHLFTQGSASDDTVRDSLIADIYKAIGADIYFTTSGVRLAFETTPVDDELVIEQLGKVIGGAIVRFKVHSQTVAWDPYTKV